MTKLVLWQNMLSHLQSAHVRALAALRSTEVTIVGLDQISAERRALGWKEPHFGEAAVVQSPSWDEVRNIVSASGPDCIHLLAGWRGLRFGRQLLSELISRSAHIGLLTEGADVRGWRGLARRAIYVKDRFAYSNAIDFILAMGEDGVNWFRQAGYPATRIFPYAYIPEPPTSEPCTAGNGVFQMLFIGQYVSRKGMDLALKALASIEDQNWRLTLIGGGEAATEWTNLASKLRIGTRVEFLSAAPHDAVAEYLAQADLLLLPSRQDGWGAVVNEALMMGVPVICSDRCGAKDLVRDAWRGEVVRAGSVKALEVALRRWMAAGKRTPAATRRIREWSLCIQPSGAAQYFLDVVNHIYRGTPRPAPPWLQHQQSPCV